MFRILFHTPEIPGNTGNAIRLAAITGPNCIWWSPWALTFPTPNSGAGLDYHDLAVVTVHPDIDAAWAALEPERVFAFTSDGETTYTDIRYRAGDVLLFGPESVGLPEEVKHSPRVTSRVRLPMLPALRSLNLANAASIAVYEAWRQNGFAGAKL
ncbi:tRNA (cytidine(34)-2'-O)-methyltransferase [Arthrobacter sp. NicSoilC12]|uniref:tRNA (cytidine(34)-2'-O)-methyltransferase n=1 Tax=Arthrobacter sp. NicSoilC12 TaxID=2831001 RepID=UPI001CC82F96|nr:tRNA (cytidine(34)-2'-O)-methyltransferase [Arthrobacter sp. NicSoilC12]GIU55031.1 putative tRNA (cytidine(34)-2'-O)-methyltransferase [Arthrobacter sp. NicSoilC12]